MNKEVLSKELLSPKFQTRLIGYKDYFEYFINFKINKNIPKVMLFSGIKGMGKNTFTYHLVNYFLSEGEPEQYSIKNFIINEKNKSFNLLLNNLHPNFYLIDCGETKKKIEVEQIRLLKSFLNRTTYLSGNKIILIDGAENLNINSANAILKITEEPTPNTYFFLVQDSSFSIIETIKSRCLNFKIFFPYQSRLKILSDLLTQYDFSSVDPEKAIKLFPHDSPGNIISYIAILEAEKLDIEKSMSSQILQLIDKYLINKKKDYLYFIKTLIENFYYKLFLSQGANFIFAKHKFDIIKKINEMHQFNLDEKNVLYDVRKIITSYEK